jgi:Na+/proline symporter
LPGNEKRTAYIIAIKEFLPPGLKGLMLVSLLAAYMSTISTQLNWGASFIVNDIFKRLLKKPENYASPEVTQKNYIFISRITTVVIMITSLLVTTQIESISGVWSFLLECGAGLGLVLILRWYWWRINAITEITATIIPFLFYGFSKFYLKLEFPNSYFFTVGMTTIAWIIACCISKPEKTKTLHNFVTQVKPSGIWNKIYNNKNITKPKENLKLLFIAWLSSVIAIYSVLFFIGKIIFLEYSSATLWLSSSIIFFSIMYWAYTKTSA